MKRATVWTWNVNCLEESRLDERTEAACFSVFLRPDPPDVLLLQEVNARTWHAHWKHHLQAAGYYVMPPDPTGVTESEYFVLAAVRGTPTRATFSRFYGSGMGRGLLVVEFNGWMFCTAHLESGRGASDERVSQLTQVCARMRTFDGPAVFAGDTNLRVEEEERVRGLAELTDAWVACGSKKAQRATWLGGKVGARFDRVLARGATPTSFARMGVEPLPGLGRISDHVALVVELVRD